MEQLGETKKNKRQPGREMCQKTPGLIFLSTRSKGDNKETKVTSRRGKGAKLNRNSLRLSGDDRGHGGRNEDASCTDMKLSTIETLHNIYIKRTSTPWRDTFTAGYSATVSGMGESKRSPIFAYGGSTNPPTTAAGV
jgi:hypothetical protein